MSVPLVLFTSVLIALAFVTLLTLALRAQRRPAMLGIERLIGREGVMRTSQSIQVAGEMWTALPEDEGNARLEPGQWVVVTAVRGLKLLVRPKKA